MIMMFVFVVDSRCFCFVLSCRVLVFVQLSVLLCIIIIISAFLCFVLCMIVCVLRLLCLCVRVFGFVLFCVCRLCAYFCVLFVIDICDG